MRKRRAPWLAAVPFIGMGAAELEGRCAAGSGTGTPPGWFQGLRENTVAELAFTGPALLREASPHRQAGSQRRRRPARSRSIDPAPALEPVKTAATAGAVASPGP